MFGTAKALIFDMDGVIINSEPLWRKAMIKGFNKIGLDFTEDDCRKTTGMRLKEVIELWLKHYQISDFTISQVDKLIIDNLISLIEKEGKAIDGILDIINYCKEKNIKTGLATSSDQILMDAVLKKLQLQNSFDAVVSAEKMTHGKPHPEVFLACAQKLNVKSTECLVIEDSVNGVIAAKAAQMRVFSVPDIDHKFMKQFAVADYQCDNMKEVLSILKTISINNVN
jgi:mannitol-1-/sugar-/sorbitol-6-/2-deoxyglucose-6-phosphatase